MMLQASRKHCDPWSAWSVIWFYTGQCSGVVASEPISGITILFSFERGLTRRPGRVFDKQLRPSGVCVAFGHSWCDKRIIGESLNLVHNVAPIAAEIGQLTGDIASFSGAYADDQRRRRISSPAQCLLQTPRPFNGTPSLHAPASHDKDKIFRTNSTSSAKW